MSKTRTFLLHKGDEEITLVLFQGLQRRNHPCLIYFKVHKKVGFQGLRSAKNRSILMYVRIFSTSVTQKSPFLCALTFKHRY